VKEKFSRRIDSFDVGSPQREKVGEKKRKGGEFVTPVGESGGGGKVSLTDGSVKKKG